MVGHLEQSAERRHRAGGDDIEFAADALGLAHGRPSRRRPSASTTLWRNSARSRRGSTRVTGPSTRQAMTIPGRPAPEPMSTQDAPARGSNRTSCAESRMWRSHRSRPASTRKRDFGAVSSAAARHRLRAARMFHVKQGGRRPAPSLDHARRGGWPRRKGPTAPPASRRGPRRLVERLRPRVLEPLDHLVRKARESRA